MGRKALQIKGYTSEDIRALFDSEDKYKTGMRLYAVYQVSKGVSSRKLEELYNTSFKQICNWAHRFEENGLEGLKDKPKSGRKSRLTEQQKDEIKSVLLNNRPDEFGYNTSTWSGPILIDYVKNRYDITYMKAQIYNVLKTLGLSFQKGRPTYPEADEKTREEFKTHLKKTSRRT